MKKFFLALVISLMALVTVTVLMLYLALQSQPSTIQKSQISASAAQKSQHLAKRIASTLKQNNQISVITTTQHEIDGLTALMHRAFPQVSLDVRLSKFGASANASLQLPLPEFIRYLNIHAFVLPSEQGLAFEQITVGDLAISGPLFIKIARWLVNNLVQDGIADKALAMINAVEINEQQIVAYIALKETLDSAQSKSILLTLRDELALFGDVEKISFYYQSLSEFAQSQSHQSSIAGFIRYLFELARVRGTVTENYVASEENQAALMALVIYFGADRFEQLVGDVIIRDHQSLVLRNRMRRNVTLQDRVDLQQHFIYSIALQLFSTHGASDALGEFKEFLDTNEGGSGFSFADLQADRAGTRLAIIVTRSEQHATQAQQLLAKVTDQELLPSINGLQEGLHQQNFEQQFQHADSQHYQQAIGEIDSRLKSLPVYQLGWE